MSGSRCDSETSEHEGRSVTNQRTAVDRDRVRFFYAIYVGLYIFSFNVLMAVYIGLV